jgi:hypothetical protein
VDTKLVTRKSLIAFAVAMALVVGSNFALADSVFEWAYWDVSPSAGENSEQGAFYPEQAATINTATYNGYDNITAEQMRFGFSGGELLEASDTPVVGTWVGYMLFDTRLDTGEKGSETTRSVNNVAVIGFTPTVGADTLTITSDREALNMGFDNTKPDDAGDNRRSLTYGAEEGDFFAVYNSDAPDTRRTVETNGQSLHGEVEGRYFSFIGVEKYSTVGTLFGSFSLNGLGVIGKVMPLADIATQAASNASYNFNGRSVNGGHVFLTVNFGAATWRADFGESKYNYGYSVENGTISGATLNSTNVVGDQLKVGLAESVVSGKVTGSLVGVMNAGASSSAGAIGKTELNVLVANGGAETVKVNDAFATYVAEQVGVKK